MKRKRVVFEEQVVTAPLCAEIQEISVAAAVNAASAIA